MADEENNEIQEETVPAADAAEAPEAAAETAPEAEALRLRSGGGCSG